MVRSFMKPIVVLSVLAMAPASSYAGAILFGVTGDGGTPPESLFTLSTLDASSSFFMALGNGADGESIGYNPVTGLMNHGSGFLDGDRFWEEIDLGTRSIVSSQQQSGPTQLNNELLDLTFNVSTGFMMATDRNNLLYEFTTDGVASILGSTDGYLKGLAFVGSELYGADAFTDDLYQINPLDGTTLDRVTLFLDGMPGTPVTGVTGLATHPDTGELWGIVKAGTNPRVLGKIDPKSGKVITVGPLGTKFAGIEFVAVPEPGTLALLVLALTGLAAFRRTTL